MSDNGVAGEEKTDLLTKANEEIYKQNFELAVRNKILEDTDGRISSDMPQSIQQQWIDYRNLLRDLPDALAEFPAYIAAHMFPRTPGGASIPDGTNKVMYTGGGISQPT